MMEQAQFDELVKGKVDHILSEIQKQKSDNKDSLLYPFFIPERVFVRYNEFKDKIIELIKKEGYEVTDFLPGNNYVTQGENREIFICWTPEAKAEVEEKEGYSFQ